MTSLLMKLSISEGSLCLTWLYEEDIKVIHYGYQRNPTLPFLRISGDIQKCFTFGTQKVWADLNTILEEIDVIETREELANVKKQLEHGKHTCLVMRMEHPRAYEV